MASAQEDDAPQRDPTQVALPHTDAGFKMDLPRIGVYNFPAHHLKYAVPGGAVLFGLILAWALAPWLPLAFFMVGGGIGFLLIMVGIYTSTSAPDTMTAKDVALAPLLKRWRQRVLPWGHTDFVQANVHGTHRIDSDGVCYLDDGRLLGAVRVPGRNTDLQTEEEHQTTVTKLRQAIDERCEGVNFEEYSTTRDFQPETYADKFREHVRSRRYDGPEWKPLRSLLSHVADFIGVKADQWDAKHWHHYVIVSVEQWEVEDGVFSGDSEERLRQRQRRELRTRLERGVQPAFDRVAGGSVEVVGPVEMAELLSAYWAGMEHSINAETVATEQNVSVWPHPQDSIDPSAPHQPEAVTRNNATDGSVATVADISPTAHTATDGGSQAQTTTEENVQTTVVDEDPDRTQSRLALVRDRLLGPVDRAVPGPSVFGEEDTDRSGLNANADGEGPTPLQDAIAPSQFALAEEGYVTVGDQLCKTFCMGKWPKQPTPMFLSAGFNLRGVDVDVKIDVDAVDTEDAKHRIEQAVGSMDADLSGNDGPDMRSRHMVGDAEAYETLYDLLYEEKTNAWDICGYVTVRVDTERALEFVARRLRKDVAPGDANLSATEIARALDTVLGDDGIAGLKRAALEEDIRTVRHAFEDAPASMTFLTDDADDRQWELFQSCAPTGANEYAEACDAKRKWLVGTGTVAATLPANSLILQEDNGVYHGRNMQNGSLILADPRNRGKAPHVLTIADSGSGKSTFIMNTGLEWWADDPDRTLIVCDTFGDFQWMVDLLPEGMGNHIVVGGDQTINPLHIEKTPQEALDALDGLNPYQMKADEVVEFLSGILRSQGLDASEYAALLRDVLRWTYETVDIYPNDIESHGNDSPTMSDYMDVLEDVAENPEKYADTTAPSEIDELEHNAGRLLRKLSGFQEGRDYDYYVGEDTAVIPEGEISFLDLTILENKGDAEAEANLNLMLGKVYERVKQADGEVMFVIDEAHYLLHSKEMTTRLQRASRHWRHYNSILWLASQRPSEFVSADKEKDKHKETIRTQCATKHFLATEDITDDQLTYGKFGMNQRQARFIDEVASTGESDGDYSQMLINFKDINGLVRSQVSVAPLLLHAMEFDSEDHGEFRDYLQHGPGNQSSDEQSNEEQTASRLQQVIEARQAGG